MNLSQFAEKIEDLPTLPMVAKQINSEAQSDILTSKALSEIVGREPTLAVKVLKLANSAFYGLSQQVTTIDRAITLLGFDTIKKLALTLSLFKMFKQGSLPELDLEGLWYHSLACASATKTLAGLTNSTLEEEAFTCGLIHDIGIIGMSHAFPKETARVVELMKESGLTQGEAESHSFGFTHQEAGALLAEQWNFPEKYQRAIRFHHNPYVESVDPEQPDSLLIYAVYAGNQIVKAMAFGRSFDMKMTGIDLKTWKILGTTPKVIIDLKSQIKKGFAGTLASWGLA